jgi:transcriptional regulator with XRE-family HTH domain
LDACAGVAIVHAMANSVRPVGDHLREWRQRRRMSQLDLASEAEVSTRHLSFVETGRSQPSREMVLHLAERLDVPLRDRNVLLVAAGFAPVFPESGLDDPTLDAVRKAVDLVLKGHEPYPALAIDRRWELVASNAAVAPLLAGVDEILMRPPVNVLRLSLHPAGLAPRIVNYMEWRSHLIARLRRQIEISADPDLAELMSELRSYPPPPGAGSRRPASSKGRAEVVVPFQLATKGGCLSFISTTTVFGTPIDITLSELAIESFFPADVETAARLQRKARSTDQAD